MVDRHELFPYLTAVNNKYRDPKHVYVYMGSFVNAEEMDVSLELREGCWLDDDETFISAPVIAGTPEANQVGEAIKNTVEMFKPGYIVGDPCMLAADNPVPINKDSEKLEFEPCSEAFHLVITNKDHRNCAVFAFIPEILEQLADILDDNLFICCQTVHDFVVHPAKTGINPVDIYECYAEMKKEGFIPDEIWLTDDIFVYQRMSKKLSVMKGEKLREISQYY